MCWTLTALCSLCSSRQVKRLLVEWKPLEEDGILPHLRKWRKAFRLALVEDEGVVDVYGQTRARERKEVDREMTPFESLIWNLWLPKVRSAIKSVFSLSFLRHGFRFAD